MAETVSVRTNAQGYVAGGDTGAQVDEVHVTSFYGEQVRGRMVQVTVGDKYVCMTLASAEMVAAVVGFAARHHLSEYPPIVS